MSLPQLRFWEVVNNRKETKMSGFTHFDAQGNAIMVDVTDKDITERCATASGCIRVSREVFDAAVRRKREMFWELRGSQGSWRPNGPGN